MYAITGITLGRMEDELRQLPMPVAFLRAGWFMENAQWDMASARDNGVVESFLAPLDQPFPMVATRDVGVRAAALLQEHWDGVRVVELEGPVPTSPDDLAAAFTAGLGRPVRARAVARDTWDDRFRSQGMTNPKPRMRMLDGFNEGWIAFEGESERGTTDIREVIAGLVSKAG